MLRNETAAQPHHLCETCDEEITERAHWMCNRYTLCSYCYRKKKLDEAPPLDELLTRRKQLKKSIKELEPRSVQADIESKEFERKAWSNYNNLPFWKKLISNPPSALGSMEITCSPIYRSAKKMAKELRSLKYDSDFVTWEIKGIRDAQKKYREESQRREATQRRKTCSLDGSLEINYERNAFKIRNKDYKRGNALDNHFRNKISDHILSTFGERCLCCSSTNDLTIDHFAIPKNEGGNFVLYLQGDESIKLNIAVLCRSCNSSKGERDFKSFFTEEEIAKAMNFQRILLEWILSDATTMTIIRKWYRK